MAKQSAGYYLTNLEWQHAEKQWHPGMYEGLTEAQARAQVGTCNDLERKGFKAACNCPPSGNPTPVVILPADEEDLAYEMDRFGNDQRNG